MGRSARGNSMCKGLAQSGMAGRWYGWKHALLKAWEERGGSRPRHPGKIRRAPEASLVRLSASRLFLS